MNRACFLRKTPEFTKMGEVHELFVLAGGRGCLGEERLGVPGQVGSSGSCHLFLVSKGKSQFKKCLGKRLEVPDILLPDIRGLLILALSLVWFAGATPEKSRTEKTPKENLHKEFRRECKNPLPLRAQILARNYHIT